MIKRISISFITFLFTNLLYSQANVGEQRIDSIINSAHSSADGPNYLIYYIEGAWIPGPILYYIDLDTGDLCYFNTTMPIAQKKSALKRKAFNKIKSVVINLKGINNQYIANVEDGCEGKILIFRNNILSYSYYFLGSVPEDINDLSMLLNSLNK